MKYAPGSDVLMLISRRSLLSLVSVAAVVGGAFYAGAHSGNRPPPEQLASTAPAVRQEKVPDQVTLAAEVQRNIGLLVQPAVVRPITRSIPATGFVGYDQTQLARVRPLARGRLESIAVSLGDTVKINQTLGVYDNPSLGDARNQLRAAQEGFAQARAQVETVRAAYERAQQLAPSGGVSRGEVERQRAELARANAMVQTKASDSKYWDETVRRFTPSEVDHQTADPSSPRETSSALMAPFAGTVVMIGAAPGETIEVEREVFTIGNLDTVWVQAILFQNDYAHVHIGYAVTVHVNAYPNQSFTGTITYVADAFDPNSNTARVQCDVVNHGRLLKPNMFASIEIAEPLGYEGVTVPDSAIQTIDDRPVVFIRSDKDSFIRRDVTLGIRNQGWTEITQGVGVGEVVVTDGSFHIKSAMLKSQFSGG
jgi:membrane fusion protein, heavy metal efflux system